MKITSLQKTALIFYVRMSVPMQMHSNYTTPS